MEYIIFDLEFNQFYKADSDRSKREEKCPLEIIQIGAIKLNENLEDKAIFNTLVRPQIYKRIHPFVEKLTNISSDMLIEAQTFEKVFKDFVLFLGDKNNTLVVWGMSDLQVLLSNINYYELNLNQIPKGYINIQKHTSKQLQTPKGTNIGLQNAVSLLGIDLKTTFHNAFNDAVYTTKIFQKLYSENMKPEIYVYNQRRDHKKENNIKKDLDKQAFIHQFEKMYQKHLSKEEIEMITLAYRMGATHQFLISSKKS